jgi:NAD(P)-dependent dehydrogenase (short-subunit alcohol dehydrogenase family)
LEKLPIAAFTEAPDQAWIDGYALKFFGCVRVCRLFWPLLKAAQGSIVNIGGGAARSPGADFSIDPTTSANRSPREADERRDQACWGSS